MFDEYINACPEVGTRNLRTEESIHITLDALLPKLRGHGSKCNSEKKQKRQEEK
jgi:hypothetical protein